MTKQAAITSFGTGFYGSAGLQYNSETSRGN
ncbi:hypothetical protein RsTz2092_13060 [Deferribacterales bacterium RsTz2092]